MYSYNGSGRGERTPTVRIISHMAELIKLTSKPSIHIPTINSMMDINLHLGTKTFGLPQSILLMLWTISLITGPATPAMLRESLPWLAHNHNKTIRAKYIRPKAILPGAMDLGKLQLDS